MDSTRNRIDLYKKKEIIDYLKSIGIDVRTTTKALGHQGFFRVNRIDISKNIKDERLIPTILHEFSHYIIYNIKPICKDLMPIFETNDEILYDELIKVTNFVDTNSTFEKLHIKKNNIKESITKYEQIIKSTYPKFKRNEKFKEFNKYARFSDIKYLLKHDAIKILHWFNYKTYSIMNLEEDIPDMPKEFVSYLKLKSCQRRQTSISRKINKLNKYYHQPTELFARFIEGIYIDLNYIKHLAPNTYNIFKNLYDKNHYKQLNQVFKIVNIII